MAKLTIAALIARIAADTTKLAEMQSAEKLASVVIAANDKVSYNYGRGETRQVYNGVVAAAYETDKGKFVSVLTGVGADIALHQVAYSAVISVGEFAEVDAEIQAETGGADADPLAFLN